MLTLTRAAPRTAKAWTGNGTSHEQRGLKHRPEGSVRTVPIPPVLVTMLRHHYRCYGTAPDGRLFRGARGGPLSESSYGRTWHAARTLALGPAAAATTLARRPYDLRHAALSLWLNAGAAPAQIAQRAGHSITMLLAVYTHCIDGHGDITNRQNRTSPLPHELRRIARKQAVPRTAGTAPILSAICPCLAHTRVHGRPTAKPRATTARTPHKDHRLNVSAAQSTSGVRSGRRERTAGPAGSGPRMAHNGQQAVYGTACFQR